MKKNLLITLLVFTAFSTMFARYDSTTGTGLLGAGAPVNPGVGPVITAGAGMGFIPERITKKYGQAVNNGQTSCNGGVGILCSKSRFDADQKAAYAQAVKDFQKYYGFTKDQASCYACIYANSVN